MKAPHSPIVDIIGAITRPVPAITQVYPLYIAWRIKSALEAADPKLDAGEQIIEGKVEVETLGCSRYAVKVTDHNGTKYRITVEIEDEAANV